MGKVVVYAPAETSGTLPLFLLYPYIRVYSVGFNFSHSKKNSVPDT